MTAYTKSSPGRPIGGNYALGDTITDSVGTTWECITAGSGVLDNFIGTRKSDGTYELAPPTSINTAGNVVLTAAQVLSGIIVRDTNGLARTDTLPTAAQMVAGLAGVSVGDIISCSMVGGGAAVWTIAAGAGGAFDPNQLAAQQIVGVGNTIIMKIRFSNVTPGAEAYTVYL